MALFKIPSLSEMRDLVIAVGKAMFPDRNFGNKRSYHARRATYVAAAATHIHKHVDAKAKDLMPTTAGDDGGVDAWGDINGTGVRKGATPARKSAAGRVKGSVASTVTNGQELVHQSSGLRFKVNQSVTIPAAGQFDADIVAIDTGAATRLSAGEVLEFVVTPAGIETQVTLVKDLDEDGFDREQYGAYRRRMLDTFGKQASGGNQTDYVKWALEIAGISQAYCYANRAGIGTIDVVVLHTGSGSVRIPTSGELATALAFLKTKAPANVAGVAGAIRVLIPVADPQSVELLVSPTGEASWQFDWDDSPGYTVAGWTAGTRELQFTGGALPSSLKAGHRLILKGVASTQDGREYTIEAISAVDKVVLETAPANAPAATDVIYSGGPLVAPIRNAIVAHMNGELVYAGKSRTPLPASSLTSTVGLEVLAEGIGPANPAGLYGTWSGALLRALLGTLAMYQRGVRNYSITTPAADYEATDDAYPSDFQIHLITPNAVIVRKGP